MRAAHLCVAATSRPRYERRRPEQTTLYRLVQQHYETFVAAVEHAATGAGLPQFVKDEFDAYLDCGILARGFIRLRCEGCARDIRVAFSCKRRGICPSCGTRRMAETAAYLVQVASCTYRIAAGPRAGRSSGSLPEGESSNMPRILPEAHRAFSCRFARSGGMAAVRAAGGAGKRGMTAVLASGDSSMTGRGLTAGW